jgi:hypothetical protein
LGRRGGREGSHIVMGCVLFCVVVGMGVPANWHEKASAISCHVHHIAMIDLSERSI